MAILVLFPAVALCIIALTAVANALMFPRLTSLRSASRTGVGVEADQPPVSILIPARNEATVIGRTIAGLLAQDCADFELLILDDNSRDGTGVIAQRAGSEDVRLRVVSGAPLPPGWSGKNWACQQLGELARGDLLLFTDADVQWAPGALSALIAHAKRTHADLLTIWPKQQTITWSERLVVPLMALAIIGYLPLMMVHHSPFAPFAAANGQCMLFRRLAYEAVGGHAAVCSKIVEDVALARLIKRHKLRLRMADGAGLIACRMYRNWPAVRDGFAKNILAGHSDSLFFLFISTIFHWVVFVLPWLWMLIGVPWAWALVVSGAAVRALTAAVTRQRVIDALLMPVSVMLMTRIAVLAVLWRLRYGGPRWKDRVFTISHPS